MKYLLLVLLSLSVVACASHSDRSPSSEEVNVQEGINHEYYGTR